jgi:hypothetical protein
MQTNLNKQVLLSNLQKMIESLHSKDERDLLCRIEALKAQLMKVDLLLTQYLKSQFNWLAQIY